MSDHSYADKEVVVWGSHINFKYNNFNQYRFQRLQRKKWSGITKRKKTFEFICFVPNSKSNDFFQFEIKAIIICSVFVWDMNFIRNTVQSSFGNVQCCTT